MRSLTLSNPQNPLYLYSTVLSHQIYSIALHCIALHCIALHCIALHCIALHCIALHCIAFHVIFIFIRYHAIPFHSVSVVRTTVLHNLPHLRQPCTVSVSRPLPLALQGSPLSQWVCGHLRSVQSHPIDSPH